MSTAMTAPAAKDRSWYLRMGKYVWVTIGVLVLGWALVQVLAMVSLVAIPLVLALFPAALLTPASRRLKERGVPKSLASLGLMLVVGAVIGGLLWLIIPQFVAQLQPLTDAFARGVARVQEFVNRVSPVDLSDIATKPRQALESGGPAGLLGPGLAAATWVTRFLTGFGLFLIAVFFYLMDGRRMWAGIVDLLPQRAQGPTWEMSDRIWITLGAYMRGQFLVATIDAVLIGAGLWILNVPLVLPLTVLTFVGALFPVVGALVSGLLAVLVALADQGLTTALIVLAIVVIVQQLEGNVLQPLIMSEAVALHPMVVLAAITAGALLLGVLGAFLAVPVSAAIARIVDYFRGRPMPGDEPVEAEPEEPAATPATGDESGPS